MKHLYKLDKLFLYSDLKDEHQARNIVIYPDKSETPPTSAVGVNTRFVGT